MPEYLFICSWCGLSFTANQHMTDEPFEPCPACQKKVRRAIQQVSTHYHGSGFYTTDNRKVEPLVKPPKGALRKE